METSLYLIKIGEISLKKGNRAYFERLLKENIKRKLPGESKITIRAGRYYLETALDDQQVTQVLSRTPGIVAFSKALRVEKSLEALSQAAEQAARDALASGLGHRFKFEVRRTDKSLPMDSYGYARELGGRLLEAVPELVVDVKNPDFIVKVELREWGYVYQREQKGCGGLPVSTGGRAVLLLSGGIDSPVAGFMMAKRGLKLTAVHFHTPPYTSPEAHDKVLRLAKELAPWNGGIALYSVPYTEAQILVNKSVDRAATTLHSRAAMMQIAQRIAEKKGAGALVTGEALGQVASQTMESLGFTDGSVDLPVFRPLIGLDKEEIIKIAKNIGTYDTAIEPFDDCCTLFSPEKPLTRPDIPEQRAVYENIEGLEALLDQAADGAQVHRFDAWGNPVSDSGSTS